MAITTKSHSLYSALTLLAILHFFFFFPSQATLTKHTNTHDLIHRDSPLSPYYDPSDTHFDRLQNAFRRSLKRINHLKSLNNNSKSTQAPMNPGGGEYLMKISIGTPPVEVIGIADTASELIWTQCLPCIECYNQTIPLFDPSHSSSYHTIPCQSNICNSLKDHQCDKNTSTCGYRYSYLDGSHTAGNLAYETLTLGISNPISLPNIVFGCAHDTTGIFDPSGSGIIGLGHGKLSLISQLGSKIFSYCLVPTNMNMNYTSKINFGKEAVVSGPEVVTTPLVTNVNDTISYYITLEAFSVGEERIEFAYNGEGNVAVDTGTTFTLLPSRVYGDLVNALGKIISAKRVDDPNGILTLCYEIDDNNNNVTLPIITAHLKGGDLKLEAVNTFSWVRKNVVCLTMISNDDTILGNMAQTNFLVGYDLEAATVSFKPIDCTKQLS